MGLLDPNVLDSIGTEAFQRADPFPYANPEGVLTDAAFETLRASLPDLSLFEESFGKRRAHGQQPHDRYVLEYDEGLTVPDVWHELVEELRGERYTGFLARLLGTDALWMNFHWHYTPRGCSVSPHCDALRKLGSHIFYFSTDDDWDPAWGGETRMLADGGALGRRSAPDFEDFAREVPAEAMGNRSFVFARTPHSWHGVRPLASPEGVLRKVFIVVINRMRMVDRAKQWVGLPLASGY